MTELRRPDSTDTDDGVAELLIAPLNSEAPKGSKDRGQAIQPTRTNPMDETYKNLFGFTTSGRGLTAVFPLSILDEKNEVHVVFDDFIELAACDDCKASFRLKDVR